MFKFYSVQSMEDVDSSLPPDLKIQLVVSEIEKLYWKIQTFKTVVLFISVHP